VNIINIFPMYLVFYRILWLFSLLPFKVLYIISDGFYFLAYHIIQYRKKVVMNNLKKAFPEKNEDELKRISKAFYHHLCDLVIEIIALVSIKKETIMKRFRYENPELLDELYDKGKSVCMVTGHYGNWEWMTSFHLIQKHSCKAIYKKLKNKLVDRLLIDLREKFGAETVEKKEATRFMLNAHNHHELHATLFLGDQKPGKKDSRYWTKFLNQDTSVFLGVEKIARKTNQPVVFIHYIKEKRGYYTCRYIKLFDNSSKTKPYEITEAHIQTLERIIREKPEYWLWSHRRWKHKKPEYYREVKT